MSGGARYEPMAALDDGPFRLNDLAERVWLMGTHSTIRRERRSRMLSILIRTTTPNAQNLGSMRHLSGIPQNHFGLASIVGDRSSHAYALTYECLWLSKFGTILTPNNCGEFLVWVRLPQVQEGRLPSALGCIMGRGYAATHRGTFTDVGLSFTWKE
jgi:hypothetical protein